MGVPTTFTGQSRPAPLEILYSQTYFPELFGQGHIFDSYLLLLISICNSSKYIHQLINSFIHSFDIYKHLLILDSIPDSKYSSKKSNSSRFQASILVGRLPSVLIWENAQSMKKNRVRQSGWERGLHRDWKTTLQRAAELRTDWDGHGRVQGLGRRCPQTKAGTRETAWNPGSLKRGTAGYPPPPAPRCWKWPWATGRGRSTRSPARAKRMLLYSNHIM